MIGSERGERERESGAEGESEGNESGGERACCLLHATKNEVGNPSAEA